MSPFFRRAAVNSRGLNLSRRMGLPQRSQIAVGGRLGLAGGHGIYIEAGAWVFGKGGLFSKAAKDFGC